MRDLWILLYRSDALYRMDAADMLKLLLDARAHNIEHDITGLLLYHEDRFMQALEGPREEVEALYRRIALDSRHRNVALEFSEPEEERLFPDWQMGFAEVPNIRGRAVMSGVESERDAECLLRTLSTRPPAHRLLDFLAGHATDDQRAL
ncbi:MAG: BLUF domain-containing protein [Lysobacter sp.]|nr:BLUF domain-containing protein [Lysobacter sp.]